MAKTKFLRSIDSGYRGPDRPQNVQAAAVNQGQVTLTWNSVGNADTYTIRRSIAGAPYSILAQGVKGVQIPPGALADGFTNLVYGPNVTLGQNWWPFNLPGFGTGAALPNQAVQNPDGSVLLTGVANNTFAAHMATMVQTAPGVYQGIAFTECYVDWLVSFPGIMGGTGTANFPTCWSASEAKLRGVPAAYGGTQPANCQRYEEWDQFGWEEVAPFADMSGLIDWSCNTNPLTGVYNHGAGSPNSLVSFPTPFSVPNRFGGSWSKATSTTQGEIKSFINNVQVKPSATPSNFSGRILWNPWSAGQAWPPVLGTTAGSFIDQGFMAFIAGTSQSNPMTVYEMRVFQRPGAVNKPFP